MFCKFCGAPVPDGAKFCPKCGQALTPAAEAPKPVTPKTEPPKPQAKPVTPEPEPEIEIEEEVKKPNMSLKDVFAGAKITAKPEVHFISKTKLILILALVVVLVIVGLCSR